jgi:thiol-disulfide isomerase/thioredoxin
MPCSPSRRQFLLATATLAVARRAAAAQAQRTDWPAHKRTPSVRLPLLDGATWSLDEQRGHAVLLNFWASWCEPCRDEMPSLARAAERDRDAGLRVVAVDYRESREAVGRFLAANPSPLAVALDADGAVAKAFGVHAFPGTVAIGAEGRVRFAVMGECDWTDPRSRRWLDELLAPRR